MLYNLYQFVVPRDDFLKKSSKSNPGNLKSKITPQVKADWSIVTVNIPTGYI